jgi:N-carbamoylputrescine amidase
VRAALIQAHANLPKAEALDKHVAMIEQAVSKGAEIACLQEIFFGPYFCAQQDPKWFETAE